MKTSLAVIILAAGKGTRMKSAMPKVLHKAAGREMILHVLDAANTLKPNRIVVVVGFGAEQVKGVVLKDYPGAEFVFQAEQKGTGHAVQMCEKTLGNFSGNVCVLYGDVLMVNEPQCLQQLSAAHVKHKSDITMLTAEVDDPTGLGRIIRGDDGAFEKIVEEKDCTGLERNVHEVNPGTFTLDKKLLFTLLAQIKPTNAQKELYLTDIIALAKHQRLGVATAPQPTPRALVGVNTRAELSAVELYYQNVLRQRAMDHGATLLDPTTVYLSSDTVLEPDTIIHPHVVFGAGVKVESGAVILPFCHLEGAHIGRGASVGPFARIRPETTLAAGVRVGNFVEVKNSHVGAKSKMNHLAYVGDADIGAGVNIGAGTVIANYNGATGKKSRSVLADGASVGANNTLISPVKIGKNARTGGGALIRADVPDSVLAVNDHQMRVVKK